MCYKNNVELFEKLLEVEFVGEDDYELDEDIVNMLVAEHRTIPMDGQASRILVINFIKAHLTTRYNGRKFSTEEFRVLFELMESGDDIILAAYECYCLNKVEADLIETLCVLAKFEIQDQEEEIDYGSPIQASDHVENEESKRGDFQRDSWPHGFQTMVDRSKASKILEEFKPLMSSVKYTILYGVILSHPANRKGRTFFHRPYFIFFSGAKRL